MTLPEHECVENSCSGVRATIALANTALDTVRCWSDLARVELLARRHARSDSLATTDVLLIAWQFPPIVTGGVHRPLSFARYFASHGQPLTVVCAEPASTPLADGAQLAEQIPAEVRVSRVSRSLRRVPAWRYFPRVDGEMSWALRIISHALKLYRDSRPRAVIASGPPFHNAVAGALLSEIWDVPFVVDYRDEWTENPMDFVTNTQYDRIWEQRVNRRASRVVLVSHSQREHHRRVFAKSSASCTVVTNGWVPEDHVLAKTHRADLAPNDAIHIAFTGFLGKHTAPDELLDTMHDMLKCDATVNGRKVALHFVGQQADACATTLARHSAAYPHELAIASTAPQPKSEAVAITYASDMLLLINPPHLARYIPGKLYEYIATDRPVLVYGSGGEVERIVRHTGCGLVVPAGDSEALRNAIAQLACREKWTGDARQQWVDEHRREVQAAKMLQILNEVAP